MPEPHQQQQELNSVQWHRVEILQAEAASIREFVIRHCVLDVT